MVTGIKVNSALRKPVILKRTDPSMRMAVIGVSAERSREQGQDIKNIGNVHRRHGIACGIGQISV